ncbi:hypothetical protein T4A_2427 [Trichinella pseudospiralis]|uniref:Uncharacterized protein n=1 Tax=Trichinella pseudospiralis TaxID=6337 RepID=A0A0V1E7W1_TRIPS|nr:hypothetical protein T4A_2427 [Trichinella pseudospiralis]
MTTVVFHALLEMVIEFYCQLVQSYLQLVLRSCFTCNLYLSHLFNFPLNCALAISYFSATCYLLDCERIIYLILCKISSILSRVSSQNLEMSLTIYDSDNSLEESDKGSASVSDYVERSDHDSSSEFSRTLSSESET